MRQIITDVDGLTEDLTNCVMVDGGKEYVWVGHIREAVTRYTRTITREDIEAAGKRIKDILVETDCQCLDCTQSRADLSTLTTAALAADPDPLAAVRVLREWFAGQAEYPPWAELTLDNLERKVKAITQTEQEGR